MDSSNGWYDLSRIRPRNLYGEFWAWQTRVRPSFVALLLGLFRQTIVKHDIVCKALAYQLSKTERNTVTREPPDPTVATEKRADLRIDNPSTGSTYYDITIHSLNAITARDDPFATLNTAEVDKIRKHANLPGFRPFVLSQGGLLGQRTSTYYKEIQQTLSYTAREYLDSYLLTSLTRIRARTW